MLKVPIGLTQPFAIVGLSINVVRTQETSRNESVDLTRPVRTMMAWKQVRTRVVMGRRVQQAAKRLVKRNSFLPLLRR